MLKIKDRGIKNLMYLFGYVGFVAFLLTSYLYLAGSGVEISGKFESMAFHAVMALGAILATISLVIANYYYKTPLFLHNPKWSVLNKIGIKWRIFTNGWMFFYFSLIFGFWTSYWLLIKRTILTGTAFSLQQATVFTQLVFGIEPGTTIESLAFLISINIVMVLIWVFIKKYNLPEGVYWLSWIPVIAFFTYVGYKYHTVVHFQQADLFSNILFWFSMAVFIFLFASFILVESFHWFNNLTLKLLELFSADLMVILMFIAGIFLTSYCVYKIYRLYQKPEIEVEKIEE